MKKRIITRRRFLKGAALGAAAVSIQPIFSQRPLYAANPGTPGRFVVVINCLGGNDGLSMVVPAHLDAYVDRRPNINLVENLPGGEALRDLAGSPFKLHYNLANLQSIWSASDMHIVQKVAYPSPNQSHFTSQDIYSFGVRDNHADGDGRGWLGRFADAYCASPIEPLGVVSVGMGRRNDFQSMTTSPLILNNVATFRIDEDTERFQDGALRSLVAGDVVQQESSPGAEPASTIFETSRQAFELVERVSEGTAEWVDPGTYPNTTLGRNLRTVSQLLHAHDEFKTRIFYTGFSGFDTHSAQHAEVGTNRHGALMAQLDGAVGAFRDDMVAKSKWNDCIVVVISEFGRRTFENGSTGTDHGHANPFLVMGGRASGKDTGGGMTGTILNSDIGDNNTIPFQYDFRDIYGRIIQDHIGLAPTPLFPDPNYTPAINDLDIVL